MDELFNKITIVFRKEWRDALRDNKSLRMTLLMPVYFVGVFVASSLFIIHMSNQSKATNNEPIKLAVVGAEQLPPLIDWLQERGVQVDAVGDEVVGPAGPTTATRMDKFTDMMLSQTGLLGMIGKSERGDATVESIRQHKAVYLMAVGGAAYLVSKAIKQARVVAFADLGMEAIYEFDVSDMPVTVAVDSSGTSVHNTGPKEWQERIAATIGKIPVKIG